MLRKRMRKAKSLFAAIIAGVALVSSLTFPVQAAENLFVNPGFENGNFEGFQTQGENIKADVEQGGAHSGDYVLKVTGRKTADEMPFQSLTGDNVELDQWYEFSVWVKPSYTVWVALIVTPWGIGAETGAPIWNDSYGDQKVAEANTWTELKCSYRFVVADGKFYVENGFDRLPIKNHAGTGDVTYQSLIQVDFKVNAEPGAEILYVDDFSLTLGTEGETVDPVTKPDDTNKPDNADKTDNTEKTDKTDKEDKTNQLDKTDKMDKTDKTDNKNSAGNSTLVIIIVLLAVLVCGAATAVIIIRHRKKQVDQGDQEGKDEDHGR